MNAIESEQRREPSASVVLACTLGAAAAISAGIFTGLDANTHFQKYLTMEDSNSAVYPNDPGAELGTSIFEFVCAACFVGGGTLIGKSARNEYVGLRRAAQPAAHSTELPRR